MRPSEITRFVTLVVSDALDPDTAKAWFRCVKNNAPYGILATVQSTTEKGGLQSVSMVHRETAKKHQYVIPISRDLVESEAQRIIDAFSDEFPELDFDIDVTILPTKSGVKNEPKIEVDDEDYLNLCAEFSKRQHEDWVASRTADGWRYGGKVDTVAKTHPLIRPWDQIPDRYKNIDTEHPQKLLDLLNRHGYAVVAQSDLDAVLRLVRQRPGGSKLRESTELEEMSPDTLTNYTDMARRDYIARVKTDVPKSIKRAKKVELAQRKILDKSWNRPH